MEKPSRKHLPHGVPDWVRDGSYFFITICCATRGANSFCRAGAGDALLEAAAFYHEHLKWHCRLFLLMPDHVHGIVSFPAVPGLEAVVTNWKRYLAARHGIEWQRDFFDHRLRGPHQLVEKMSYVLMNPVRRGLCARPEEWPWVFRPEDRMPTSWD
jgi:REP element-mobilizing transposase RayT